MDVEAIDGGLDFVKVLEEAVQSCDVVIALIGKQWLNIKNESGERRLENPEDFVRIEIAAALNRDIRVIPILVDGVNMPRSTELPENLKPLARRNALQVSHNSFNADANRLIAHLERALEAVEASKVIKAQDVEKKKVAKREQDKAKEERRKSAVTEKARQDRLAREKQVVEEKARQDALRKARQQERIEKSKVFFSGTGKLPFYIIGGIALLFLLGYIIKNTSVPIVPEPTRPPIIEVPATETLLLPTSTFAPTAIELPREISPTPTNLPVTAIAIPTISPPSNPSIGSAWTQAKDSMVMVYVPAGEFEMGGEDGYDDEKPIHSVYLDAYWIDQTEVTNEMYAKCVSSGDCDLPSSSSSHTHDSYYGNTEFDDYPVIYVSWEDANNYCTWAGRRLPTEAEWEKAAGWNEDIQSQQIYPWGDTFGDGQANFCDTNCTLYYKNSNYDDGYADTAPVGNYESGQSFYGAYDISGNLWEWVADWYGSDYYVTSPSSNPWGPDSGTSRVLRGGSWFGNEYVLRSAYRLRLNPSLKLSYIGFRCSRSP